MILMILMILVRRVLTMLSAPSEEVDRQACLSSRDPASNCNKQAETSALRDSSESPPLRRTAAVYHLL